MQVLIAGCGDVGNVLATSLLLDGHVVYGLKRDTSSLPVGVIPIQADLLKPETLSQLPMAIEQLVFMPTPASRDLPGYEDIFIQGWTNLWENLTNKPERTLLVSSTAVFGEAEGAEVNEETPPEPSGFNGKVLLRMEQLAAQHTAGLIVARISGIYGPGRERLIRLAASENLQVQQSPPTFTNRIHLDDAAAALKHLLGLTNPEALYLLTDNNPAPRYDVIAWLAQAQAKPAPTGLTAEHVSCGKRVSNRRLRETGFEFSYPDYRTGYGAILSSRQISGNQAPG
jgi:nucleoside-diphosphate-sugar epimerase